MNYLNVPLHICFNVFHAYLFLTFSCIFVLSCFMYLYFFKHILAYLFTDIHGHGHHASHTQVVVHHTNVHHGPVHHGLVHHVQHADKLFKK
jgi:hypothetical protein